MVVLEKTERLWCGDFYQEPAFFAGMGKLGDEDVILSLTTENGGIAVDNVSKTITITMTASQTAALTFNAAVYDLELLLNNTVTRFAQGNLILNKEVTRDG